MNILKNKEQKSYVKQDSSYHCCKQNHAQPYHDLTKVYAPFVSEIILKILNHEFDTQKNEAMNMSVAALAPKTKHYCTTTSLVIRVSIAAGVSIVGHATLWARIFKHMQLQMDENLLESLCLRDTAQSMEKIKEAKTNTSSKGLCKNSTRIHNGLEQNTKVV